MTNGQRQMSVTFNPGQREDVADIKQKFANAFDAIDEHMKEKYPNGNLGLNVEEVENYVLAVKAAETAKNLLHSAQMKAVYAVTR
jgi:hypothetical protein